MSKNNENYELLQKKGKFDKLRLSSQELGHLGIAWLIFIIAFLPQTFLHSYGGSNDTQFALLSVSIMAFALGCSFIFHELGHKFAAQYFKARAEFKLDARGLLISAVSIALGFYLLQPGAVFWESNLSKYSDIRGRVSASGPIVNLHLACLSLSFFIFAGAPVGSVEWMLFTFGQFTLILNVYLGIFNMLPIWILDGKKIYEWSEIVWFSYLVMFIIPILAMKVFNPRFVFNFFIISI
jgi:Zn-dependent protease